MFKVGDIASGSLPKNDREVLNLAVQIANSVATKLPTEQDIYWFVIEQYDRMLEYDDRVIALRSQLDLSLFDIEYAGRKSEAAYVGRKNFGIAYLDAAVEPDLTRYFGESTAKLIRFASYISFCNGSRDLIRDLRLKYAVHYHNNCVSAHHWRFADKWNQVIQALGGDDASFKVL